jgi:hypothetical protein
MKSRLRLNNVFNSLKDMAWIARNKNNTLVIFNDKPVSDGFEYYREEVIESENFIDYGVELPTGADFRLLGKHIVYADGAIELT